jgi:glycosyltransferase involved in cell wall biosynthesis
MASRDKISFVIVTFNEERNIEECLETAKWGDEIIVVDSFSTDRTLEICKRYTHRIYQRPWPGFGKQKNFAIEQASMDWTFILDADERLPEELRREIEGILHLAEKEFAAYRVPRKNYFYGHWLKWGGQYPDWQIRLFKKGAGLLDDFEPHNSFIFAGKLGTLENPLIHYTERNISDHFPKLNRFTDLAAEYRVQTCNKVHWYDLAFRPLVTFFQVYLRKQGFRDGIPGFIQAVFKSLYTFVKYAKVWEIHQRRAVGENAHRN